MPRPWILAVTVVSALFTSVALGQQGQVGTTASNGSTESEISTKDSNAAIKVEVNLVLVPVVVKDSSGNPISGLKKEDFQLFDNGKPQAVSTFSVETEESRANHKTAPPEVKPSEIESEQAPAAAPPPSTGRVLELPRRFVALVFDDSHMKVAEAMAVHAAAEKLFASLVPTDRVAIYSIDGNAQQDYTGDAAELRKTLAAIVPHPAKGEGQYECPNISYYQADLIVNRRDEEAIEIAGADAVVNKCVADVQAISRRILDVGDSQTREAYQYLDSIVRKLSGMPGQRVLVYVSPGFLTSEAVLPNSSDLLERAVRAGVVVNTIDARGVYAEDGLPDIAAPPRVPATIGDVLPPEGMDYQRIEGQYRMQAQFESGQVLQGMAASTGGTYFHNRNDLDVGLSRALAVPSVAYILGFKPQNTEANGKLHNLNVQVAKGSKYSIQARNGYYATKKSADPEEQAKQEVTETLFSREEISGIPMQLKTEFFKIR